MGTQFLHGYTGEIGLNHMVAKLHKLINHYLLGRPTYLDQPSNSTRLGNEYFGDREAGGCHVLV